MGGNSDVCNFEPWGVSGDSYLCYGMLSQHVDGIFANALNWVLNSKYSDEGLEVRPKWEDGTPAHTKKHFGYTAVYADIMAPGHFPLLGLRKTFWKGAYDEILWIYQKASNALKDLNTHIWDSWDVGDGTIGKAYGYQIAQKTYYPECKCEMNQMEKVLWDLTFNRTSRSIMTTTYNIADLPEMGLRPCAYSMTYNVSFDKDGNGKLNAILNQRSWDMVTAGGWNIAQYAMLLAMVAHVTGLKCGDLVHVVADAHVYDRHEDIARQMIANLAERHDEKGEWIPSGTLIIDPDVKEFSEFGPESLTITDYNPCQYAPKIPVAV